eukprot:458930-Alexandrium_andersonii.AAC.1
MSTAKACAIRACVVALHPIGRGDAGKGLYVPIGCVGCRVHEAIQVRQRSFKLRVHGAALEWREGNYDASAHS